MDRGARDRIMRGRAGNRAAALLLLALLLVDAGCNRYEGAPPPMPSPASEKFAPVPDADGHGGPGAEEDSDTSRVPGSPAAVPEVLPPVEAAEEAGKSAGTAPADNTTVAPAVDSRPATKGESDVSPSRDSGKSATSSSSQKPKETAAPYPGSTAPSKNSHGTSSPAWARSPEELVYRIDFIGITMGYARFRYDGKVTIAGKSAYHLNVRAWTSGVLSFIYPINDTIDYYLDAETLEPIRAEFTHPEREKDDVALYNQETGRITYRYRQSGKIRKQVDTVPSVYDPVSVAYYFRWRDLGEENRPRNMYGGRKLYQISSRLLGNERIRTEHGEVDTIAVVPVIRRDGKPDSKGDLKVWFSSDERRVPVRLYAKFRKIKEWTLVGELTSSTVKAGG